VIIPAAIQSRPENDEEFTMPLNTLKAMLRKRVVKLSRTL